MNRPGYHVTNAGFCCNCRWYRRQSQACAHDSQPPGLLSLPAEFATDHDPATLRAYVALFQAWEQRNAVAPTGSCRDWQQEVGDVH